jgi:zinc transport system ATP-binding protein
MELLCVKDLANRSFRELSGGQKQRVLLARTLCAAKELILLDEPAAGLDPKVTEELYELVRYINREKKMTVVMISHDIDCAMQSATHILHLDHKMLYFGPTDRYDRDAVTAKEG